MAATSGKSNPSQTRKQYQRQGDLVVNGFQTLIAKFDGDNDPYPRLSEEPSLERIELKKEVLNRLHSNLLPLLGYQITSLSQTLDPTHLRKEPTFTLNLILGIQSQLGQTLNLIQSALCTICPELVPSQSDRMNDQHLMEFKCLRLDGIHHSIAEVLMPEVMQLFDDSNTLIQQLKLTTEKSQSKTNIARATRRTKNCAAASLDTLESTIDWIEGFELYLVQWEWLSEITDINEQLEQLSRLIGRVAPSAEETLNREKELLSEPAIGLAKSVLPIAKLSRLFFKKLSKLAVDNKRLRSFTRLRSDQLETLYDLVEIVCGDLEKLLSLLRDSDTTPRAVTREQFIQTAENLEERLENSLVLISVHFVPLIPNTDDEPTEKYIQTWLATWHDQFGTAIHLLQKASQSFQ
ncbi:hypothetical protein MJO29_015639 [Puccinia striiformis f. sp. tritici]|uniref:Uncharacterized protein n=1 Tax=Puccinia striiformis f. sp. tritici PST-78 TaxID=1165861 RepID=A0A0L0UTU7_9BASI|nr:hypothetical protein Pst134EB_029934 [Puccinia striiformis f. sp. tritici]KAI7936336.1 hypothetical protein MJO29_015639 [Puccinia striiformis f. sp. tritici]KAI9614229.1 hypothetical protein H4Q26_009370 [Puccinia striiformis f. sp. tritici PST-130]KNE90361.1 hypothetical protein PSTG_16184 [Puccinia striiformis f. sp. tritici PST-78]